MPNLCTECDIGDEGSNPHKITASLDTNSPNYFIKIPILLKINTVSESKWANHRKSMIKKIEPEKFKLHVKDQG
jgi:hypothetical protein